MNEDSSNLIPQELEVIHNNVDQNGAPILINPYILKLTERLTTITIDIINNAVQQSLDAATKSIKDAQEKFVKSIRDACYCGDNQPWKFEAAYCSQLKIIVVKKTVCRSTVVIEMA